MQRGRRRRLVVALGVLVVGLGAVEGALRLRQWVRYGTTSSSFYEMTLDEGSGLEIPRPESEVGPIRIDSRGFRGPELEVPKPSGRIRVAFLGGSTTFCAEASSLEATWPARVVAGLAAAHPGVSFDGVNGGAGGYSTRQSLANLVHRVAPLDPDVVVVYHGTNDLTQDSRELAAAQGLYDPAAREASWLGRYSLTWYLIEKNLRFQSRKRDTGGARMELDAGALAESFRERLTGLVERARETADVVCLVTFAHRARAGMTQEELLLASSSSRYYMPYLSAEDILAGFDAYNAVVREVAAATGAVLVDGEDGIPPDGVHFADSVHLLDEGCAWQAERVVAALAASPALAELVEARGRAD